MYQFRFLGGTCEFVWLADSLVRPRAAPVLRLVDFEQARRFVVEVARDGPGMRLLRSVLAGSAHFDPERLTDDQVVDQTANALDLGRLLVFRVEDFRGGGRSPQQPPHGPVLPPERTLSFYEVVVVDETDRALAGLELDLSTPGRSGRFKTDGNGRVRLDREPPGVGRASVTSLIDLSLLMKGQERRPRRVEPFPTGADWPRVRLPRISTCPPISCA